MICQMMHKRNCKQEREKKKGGKTYCLCCAGGCQGASRNLQVLQHGQVPNPLLCLWTLCLHPPPPRQGIHSSLFVPLPSLCLSSAPDLKDAAAAYWSPWSSVLPHQFPSYSTTPDVGQDLLKTLEAHRLQGWKPSLKASWGFSRRPWEKHTLGRIKRGVQKIFFPRDFWWSLLFRFLY